MVDKQKQGKRNKAAGRRFELKVRKDLEAKGWIVAKWMNQVELSKENSEEVSGKFGGPFGRLIPARHKFRGPGIPMAIGTGFPDFIAFRLNFSGFGNYQVIGVEAKSGKYLDREEKAKCKWLLDNNIFSKILIASKGKKRGEIVYNEFKI